MLSKGLRDAVTRGYTIELNMIYYLRKAIKNDKRPA